MGRNSHLCQALVITCIDFRIVEATRRWLESQGLSGQYDLLSFPGAALNLVNQKGSILSMLWGWIKKIIVLYWIQLAVKLHSIKEVIIINHRDCGAYGGSDAFKTKDSEFDQHHTHLLLAKKVIQKKLPGVKIRILFAELDHETQQVEVREAA